MLMIGLVCLQGIQKRMQSLGVTQQRTLPEQRRQMCTIAEPAVPVQMRRIRAAHTEHAELLTSAQQALNRLELLHLDT